MTSSQTNAIGMGMKNKTNKKNKPAHELPLAKLEGTKPPAPNWFKTCVDSTFEDADVEVLGASIRYRVWGDKGKPGLILVHGGVAHKSWWDFIAPFFTPYYRVVALDLSGMGQSSWRESYDMPTYAAEVLACAEDAELFKSKTKPWLVGHSFGGFVTMAFAAAYGDRFQGAVVVDSPVREADKQRRSPPPSRGGKVYETLEQALARFRLLPSQPCKNVFLIDHIARNSLKQVDGGWTWCFDPQLWPKMRYDMKAAIEVVNQFQCPVTLIRGEQSSLLDDEMWTFVKQVFPKGPSHISIPEAKHHVLLDQPLALVSALRVIFGTGL